MEDGLNAEAKPGIESVATAIEKRKTTTNKSGVIVAAKTCSSTGWASTDVSTSDTLCRRRP